jgi:DNA repair photolyase
MPTDAKTVGKQWHKVQDKKQRKLIFFPSSSDIFAENAVDYVSVCRKIIDAGHEIFFVTKPSMKSISAIVAEFEKLNHPEQYRTKMNIFITITSNNPTILSQFEPFASTYPERVETIKYLIAHQFNTNVIMEPYLSDPIQIIQELTPVLDQQKNHDWIITIGKMNYTKAMILNPDPIKDQSMKTYLDALYTPANYLKLWQFVEPNPHLFLKKDSIMALLKVL